MTATRPLTVLQLGSPTGLYGAERWILALVKHLPPERVHSIIGVVRDDPAVDPELCRVAGELGFEQACIESPGKLSWSAIGQLRHYIVERDVAVLHTHFYKTDLIGLLATRGTRCRAITTPHGWSVDAGWKLKVYEGLDRAAFPFFDAVVPLSRDLYDGLAKLPGIARRLHLIPNAVDLSEVEAAPTECPEGAEWKGKGEFVIGYIGQLIPRKGLLTLIDAFHAAGAGGRRLCLVGDGPQRAELEARVRQLGLQDRVSFLGYRQDRLSLLKNFDVFVLPSTLEGIPRCLLESMGAGVPVIATDIPGCRDIVTDGRTGLLFPMGDAGTLAARLQQVSRDGERARALAAAAREMIRLRYSAEGMALAYADLYERTVAGQGNAAPAAREGSPRERRSVP